jgi:BlaI family transcriptional regulator, penicillinase repressor
MFTSQPKRPKALSELEHLVMDFVWSQRSCSAEEVREALALKWPMKESTARTILRRLEQKGYLAHEVEGRTYIYRSVHARQNVAVQAVQQIVDRFCGGSVEQLLVGMVDGKLVGGQELERLARRVAQSRKRQKSS